MKWIGWDRFDYHAELEIDEFDFVNEWLTQPKLFAKYAEACTEAKEIKDRKHEELKVARSELIIECKTDNPKATGPEIEAYYRTHKKHKRLKKELLAVEKDHNHLCDAVQAFKQRKYSLEELQQLYRDKYYAEPYMKKGDNKFVDEIIKTETRKKIAKKMKRSKRTRFNAGD